MISYLVAYVRCKERGKRGEEDLDVSIGVGYVGCLEADFLPYVIQSISILIYFSIRYSYLIVKCRMVLFRYSLLASPRFRKAQLRALSQRVKPSLITTQHLESIPKNCPTWLLEVVRIGR